MTYKAIVKSLVEEKSRAWTAELIKENNIRCEFITVEKTDFDVDNTYNTIFWTVRLCVYISPGIRRTIEIGGTADDLTGICESVVWNEKHDILWMSSKKTRAQLGIEKFSLAG